MVEQDLTELELLLTSDPLNDMVWLPQVASVIEQDSLNRVINKTLTGYIFNRVTKEKCYPELQIFKIIFISPVLQ